MALQKTADLGGLFPHDKVFSFVAKIVCLSKQVSYVSSSKSLLYCIAQVGTYTIQSYGLKHKRTILKNNISIGNSKALERKDLIDKLSTENVPLFLFCLETLLLWQKEAEVELISVFEGEPCSDTHSLVIFVLTTALSNS